MRGRVGALGLLISGLASVLGALPVRADYLVSATQTQTIDATETNFRPGTAALLGKDPFTITQFDPSTISAPKGQVAVLEGVTVSLQYQFVNTIQLTFTQAATETVTASGVMHLGLNDANHPNDFNGTVTRDIVNAPVFYAQKTLSAPGNGPGQVPINTNYLDTPKVVGGTSALFYTDANTLSIFTGHGVITAPVSATASSTFANSAANGAGGSNTFASAALSVTYYYNFFAVPEPTSFVLTGLGAAGLCLISRARTRRKGDGAS